VCSVLYTASHGHYRRTQLFKAETNKVLLAFIDCTRSSGQLGTYPTNSIWDLLMRQPVKQIAYKYCINYVKLNFRTEYSASADGLTLSLRCKYCKTHSRSNFQDAINRPSIRQSAASDCKPMTSVFYDVIRLESVRGRSNMLIEGQF